MFLPRFLLLSKTLRLGGLLHPPCRFVNFSFQNFSDIDFLFIWKFRALILWFGLVFRFLGLKGGRLGFESMFPLDVVPTAKVL